MQPSASRRSRYSTDQFSRAAAAGCPRSWNSFNGDSQSWNAYQHGWIQQFSPEFELAPVGDSRRRKQWESAVRQWRGIEAARERDGRHAMIASQPDAAVGPTSSSAMTGSTHYEEGIAAGPSACHPLHTTMDGQPAAALRLRTHLGARPSWIQQHAPNIRAIDIGTPSLTPSGLHATRELRADVLTPGGHEARHTESVSYTLPPRDGEADDAARRRDERHSKRERDQLRRLSKAPV